MPFLPLVASCLCWNLQGQGCPLSLSALGSARGCDAMSADSPPYLSWPAVSQSCSAKHLWSTSKVLTRKSTPRTHGAGGWSGLLLSHQPGLPVHTCPGYTCSPTPAPLSAGLPSPWFSNPTHIPGPTSSKRPFLTTQPVGSQSPLHSHTLTVSASSRHLAIF